MLRVAPLTFLVWIFCEIAFALNAVQWFGFANVFFFWLIKTVIGLGLVRTTGFRLMGAFAKGIESAGAGVAKSALSQILVSLAGLLLVLPGFITDSLAIIILLAALIVRWTRFNRTVSARDWFARHQTQHQAHYQTRHQERHQPFSETYSTSESQPIRDASQAVIDVEKLD